MLISSTSTLFKVLCKSLVFQLIGQSGFLVISILLESPVPTAIASSKGPNMMCSLPRRPCVAMSINDACLV